MKKLIVLGIMSGTSIDSVDYALCRVKGDRIRLEEQWQVNFPTVLQRQLHRAAQGSLPSHELAQLHHDLGRFYAANAVQPAHQRKPQLVGLHGQTLFHNPNPDQPATFQAGEPAYLVEALQVPVVNNFRAADLAAGGQGAPLASLFHRVVFGQRGLHLCINNLGGISNVTSIDWRSGREPTLLAFDTGPANVLLDLAVGHFTEDRERMDRDGAWAAKGEVSREHVTRWLEEPYFRQAPPKSTGRELFGEPFLKPVLRELQQAGLDRHGVLATLTEFTARSIAVNYRLHLSGLPQTVILTGGGAANVFLVERIRANLQELSADIYVVTSEQLGWPLQSIEPAAFAHLAYLRYYRKPANIPGTTGARRRVLLGQLSEP